MDITCLGYYVLGVRDLKAWENFAVDILGLQLGRYDGDDMITLRMDEYEQRVVLEESLDDDLSAVGWEFDNETKLEQFIQKVASMGVEVTEASKEFAIRRRVEKVYICDDPNGFKHEFYYGPVVSPCSNPFKSKALLGSGFVTGRIGIGHIVPVARNYQETVAFYRDVLGLRVSDYIKSDYGKKSEVLLEATFFHTVTGRHHSVATGQMSHPKKVRHIMLQVQDMIDLGKTLERCERAGCLGRGLGMHSNDKMLSFYINTPSGFQIEYGWGGIVIDDDNWKVNTHFESSFWGHKRLENQHL